MAKERTSENRSAAIASLFEDTLAVLEKEGKAVEEAQKNAKKNSASRREEVEAPSLPKEETPSIDTEEYIAPDDPAEDDRKTLQMEILPFNPEEEQEGEAPPEEVQNMPDTSLKDDEDEAPPSSDEKHPFKTSRKKLGESITKEEADQIRKGKPKDGFRGTIIIHKKTVDTTGKVISEEMATKEQDRKELCLIRVETGEVYTLDRNLSIGRDIDNDVVIPEPDGHYVSGHHANISVEGNDIWLEDISTNGTKVNGQKIKKKRIYDGNKVRFADIDFVVERR